MRTKLFAVLLIGGLLTWGASAQVGVQAEPKAEPTVAAEAGATTETAGWSGYLGDPVFAKKVAGTYLTNFLITNPFTGEFEVSGSGLVQIFADGNFTFMSENIFGLLGAPGPRRHDTPAVGTWERSGRRQIKWHLLSFAKEEEARVTSFVFRQEAKLSFSDDFESFDLMFFTSLVFPGAVKGTTDALGKFRFTACEEYDCDGTEGCCDCCIMRDCERDCVRDECWRDEFGECLPEQPPEPPPCLDPQPEDQVGPCLRGLYIPDPDTECIIPGDELGSCLEWCVQRDGGLFAPCDRTANTPDEDRNGVEDSLECLLFPANPNAGPDECQWWGPFMGQGGGARMHVLPDDWAPWPE